MIERWVVHDAWLYSVLDTAVISSDDVCCNVVFGTIVGMFVFSVMWSKLLIISAIRCYLWSSEYECQRVEYAFTSPVRSVVKVTLKISHTKDQTY